MENKPTQQQGQTTSKRTLLQRLFTPVQQKELPSVQTLLGQKKKEKVKKSLSERRQELKDHLIRTGIPYDPKALERWFLRTAVGTAIILSLYLTIKLLLRDLSFSGWFSYTLLVALVGVPLLYGLFWGGLLLISNLLRFYRAKEIDEALPEYLELCALNVKAGMSIDRALWYSVRPKFGILAKEMEVIAKRTLTGDNLVIALREMSEKFDSPMLKRTVSLITEGVESGGELGSLLHTISADLRETKILKQEMASSVTTYVIFITFASIMAAPALMGLSYHLLNIIQGFASRLDTGGGGSSSFSISPDAIRLEDYKIFAMLSLSITSFFSAAIISVIRYGNVKEGMKYIPIFIGWSLLLFVLSIRILGVFLGGILEQ